MLRVQVFPAADGNSQSLDPAATHYASLSTCTTDDGRIWSMGRKQGDFLILSDKSVSREHVVITVATTNANLTRHGKTTDDRPAAEVAAAAATCTTPAQVEACNAAPDQMCVLLRNIGKLGSYLVVEENVSHSAQKKSMEDDESNTDDDSATADDEEITKSQPQAAAGVADVPLSEVTKHLTKHAKARLQLVAADETIVLNALADTSNKDVQAQQQRAIVQCGKLGTTIVLTRVHIRVVISSDAKSPMAALQPSFYAIGCTPCTMEEALQVQNATTMLETKPEFPAMTYLITAKCLPKPKHLAAWSRRIPIVQPSFIQSLLKERKSPADPFPDVQPHAPERDDNDFWSQQADPRLWSSYTLLSFHSDGHHELETLVRSAGVKVILLYNDAGKFLDDKALWNIVKKSLPRCFAVAENHRLKICKLLKQLDVPMLTGRQIAEGITKQQRLLLEGDTEENSNESGAMESTAVAGSNPSSKSLAETSRHDKLAAGQTGSGVLHRPQDSTLTSNVIEPTARIKAVVSARKAKDKTTEKAAIESTAASPRRSTRSTPVRADTVKHNLTEKVDDDLQRQKGKANLSSKEVVRYTSPDDNLAMEESAKKPQHSQETTSRTNLLDSKVSENIVKPTASKSDHDELRRKRKKLDPSKGGWLTALPQGQKRQEYRRSKDEIREATGLEEIYEAVTVKVKGLIAHRPTSNQPIVPSVSPASSGPNFKAFRKNSVPPIRPATIRMHLAASRESEQHGDLKRQREEIEVLQRRADELFRDKPTAGASRTSRRR